MARKQQGNLSLRLSACNAILQHDMRVLSKGARVLPVTEVQ